MADTFSKIVDIVLNIRKGAGFSGASDPLVSLDSSLKKIQATLSKGLDLSKITSELDKLGSIRIPSLRSFAVGLDQLTKQVNQQNIPDLTPIANSIKKLSNLPEMPALNSLANGLNKINSIKNTGALSAKLVGLSNSLRSFKGVENLPSLSAFANGLRKINDIKNTGALSAKLVGLSNALRNFKDIRVPSLSAFANGLNKINSIKNTGVLSAKLVGLSNALRNFKDIKIPSMTPFANGLNKINSIKNTGALSAKLVGLSNSLRSFKDIRVPSINQLAKGLIKLSEINLLKLRASIKGIASSLEKLRPYESMINSLGVAFSKMKNPIGKARNDLEKTTKTMSRFGKSLALLRAKISGYLGYFVVSRIVMAISAAFSAGVGAIIDYDQSLQNLQAITQATHADIQALGSIIKKVANDTKFSASEISGAMVTLGQAGLSVKEISQSISPIANLATATLSPLSTVVDLVTTALRVFRIESSQASRVADIFAAAVTHSKLTIDKLRIAFSFVGPVAANAGVSFKEVATALSVLANSGIRASRQGTSLRRIFVQLIDPSNNLTDALNKSHVSLKDVDTRTQSLSHVLYFLRKALTDTKTGLLDAGLAAKIFGKRGVSGILALLDSVREGKGSFDDLFSRMDDVGLASRMANTQLEGLGTGFKNLQDKAKNLALALGDAGVTYALRKLLQTLKDTTVALTKFTENGLGGTLVKATGYVVGLLTMAGGIAYLGTKLMAFFGPLASFIGGIVPAIEGMAASGGIMGLIFGGMSPAGIAVIIAAIATGLTYLGYRFLTTKSSAEEAADSLKKFASSVTNTKNKLAENENFLKRFSKELDAIEKSRTRGRADRIKHGFDQLFAKFPQYTTIIDNFSKDLDGLRKATEKIETLNASKQWDSQKDSLKLYALEVNSLTKNLRDAKKEVKRFFSDTEYYKSLTSSAHGLNVIRKVTKSISDDGTLIDKRLHSIATAIILAKKNGQDFGNVFKILGKNLTSKQIQTVVSYEKALTRKSIKELQHMSVAATGVVGDTAKSLAALYKNASQEREALAQEATLKIATLEATGVISTESAEKKKLQVALYSSKQRLKNARVTLKKISHMEGQTVNSSKTMEAQKEVSSAEKAYAKEKLTALEFYGKKIDVLESKERKNIEARTQLEESYGEKVKSIQDSMSANLDRYNKKILSITEASTNKRISLEDSVQEEIRKIGLKGLTDSEKAAKNEAAAYQYLATVKRRLSNVKITGDSSGLSTLSSLMSTAHSLFGSLSDKEKAVSGLKAYEKMAKEIIKVEEQIKKREATNEYNRVLSLSELKLKSEKTIHDKKLQDLTIEFNKEKSQIEELQKLQRAIPTMGIGDSSHLSTFLKGALSTTDSLNTKTKQNEVTLKKINGVWTTISTKMKSGLNTKVKVDSSALDAVIKKKLPDKVQRIIIQTIRSSSSASTPFAPAVARASGGIIPFLLGAKRGMDSIMSFLTPGEYVIKESVVRALGANFFDAINNFKMPKAAFATGGLVGGISEFKTSGSPLSKVSPLGSLNLNIGNQSYKLHGDVDVISTLLSHIKREQLMGEN